MKGRLKVANFVSTVLQNEIPVGNPNSDEEKSFSIQMYIDAPTFVIINPDTETERDIIYIHRTDGTVCYYYDYNRTNPSVSHTSGSKVAINDIAELFNYNFKNTDDFGYIKRKYGLDVIVYGGDIKINGQDININDTEITLNNDTDNYIVFDYTDNTIKNITDLTGLTGIVLAKITTSGGQITNIEDKRQGYLPFILDGNYLEVANGKLKVKDGVFASKNHTHTHDDITDFDEAVSNNPDVSANTNARHTHSNKAVLDKITDSGDGTKYLADDGTYKEVSGGGGGASKFTDLTDTPSDYSGKGGKVVAVKNTEDGLEFIDAPSGGGGDTDTKTVKVTSDDNSDGYLSDKIEAGDNISLATDDDGNGNKKLKISVDRTGLDADTLDGKDSTDFAAANHTHKLGDLSDVDTTGEDDGTTLMYDGESNQWKPYNIAPAVVGSYRYNWFMGWNSSRRSSGGGKADGNDKVKTDSNDTTSGYLIDKIDGVTLGIDEEQHTMHVNTDGETIISDETNHDIKVKDGVFVKTTGDETIDGYKQFNKDIEVTDYTQGLILRNSKGERYRVTVNDDGELEVNKI